MKNCLRTLLLLLCSTVAFAGNSAPADGTYTLTYVVDGETYQTATLAAGAAINLPAGPAKEGYEFVKWDLETAVPIDIASNADAMLYTNAPCTDTRYGDQFTSWQVLFDGNAGTFFHSEYANNESADGLDHYLRVDMGEGKSITSFTFTYTNRNTSSDLNAPKTMVVEGSNSANGNYDELVVLTNLPSLNYAVYTSEEIGNGTAYRYIRYRVTETHGGRTVYEHPYFHIAEFGMSDATIPTTMPASDISLVAVYKQTAGICGESATWSFTDGVLTISGTGAMTDYASVNDAPWSEYLAEDITSIVVEEGITSIGTNAFRGSTVAANVSIPSTLTSIGDYAFLRCTSLTSIEIPNSVTSIGLSAFSSCNGLTSIIIGSGVVSLYNTTFMGCTGVESITVSSDNATFDSREGCNAIIKTATNALVLGCKNTVIPSSVTSIWQYAFYHCTGLTSIEIPNSVTSIGYEAFKDCSSLESITLSTNLTTIGYGAFSRTGLTSVEIPEGITSLANWTFDNSPALESVSLPSTLTSLDNWVFDNCSNLESITVLNPTPATVGSYVFRGISDAATLYVPRGATAAYEADEKWSVIPNIAEIIKLRQITYMVDGEEYYISETEIVGDEIVPLEAPEKTNYEFVEWVGLPDVMPDEDITVEARYRLASVSIIINKYGAATYSSPYALDFSEVEGLRAYAAAGYNKASGAITLLRLNTVQSGVGLFVKGNPGTYTVPILDESNDCSLNLLVATLQRTTVNERSDDGLYVNYKFTVATGSTTPMFYAFTDGSSLSAGKSYLQLPVSWLPSNASKAISIEFDEGLVTDIDEVEAEGSEGDGMYYDLFGRPVLEPVKGGIYIVNGKKVLF